MHRRLTLAYPRHFAEWPATTLILLILVSSILTSSAQATCNPTDTIYVNNTRTVPGGESGGCTTGTAFRSINAALSYFVGGTNRVIAVMGTGVPYRESPRVAVESTASGTVAAPSVLFARGTVVIDCGDYPKDVSSPAETEPNRWVPRYAATNSSIKLWATKDTTTDQNKDCNQVVMNSASLAMDRRYPENGDSLLTNMTVGQSHYKSSVDTVYAYFDDPTHLYYADDGFLCTREGIRMRASNFILDGFTVLRSKFDGIIVDGTGSRNVTIRNCVVQQSTDDGIDLSKCTACVVRSNTSTENTKNGIFLHSRTVFATVESCTVISNTCSKNNNQSKADNTTADDINGIRIGTSPDSAGFGYHLVADNKAYSNEDTGVDLRGSHGNTLRYNQSWDNGDHGFDHNGSSYNAHIGDLAYANGHDGFSVENNAHAIVTHNCIMADNGRAIDQQDYELEVNGAVVDSFVSDNNVIYRPMHATHSCTNGSYSWDEVRDSILIAWNNPDRQAMCRLRAPDPPESVFTCFGTVARFAATTARNPRQNELHSKQGEPTFGDAFRPFWSSAAVDAADTTIAGWLPTDFSGFARHDCAGKSNTGNPAGTFGDIGPFEYDDGMSPVDSVGGAYNAVSISWTGSGRYGNSSYKPIWYKIYVDGALRRTKIASNMSWPGAIIEAGIGASSCHTHSVYVTTLAESTSASHMDVTQSNPVSVTTCCSPGCSDGPELSSRRPREEDADFPLALEWSGANPSRGMGIMAWSIPRAQGGASYDLSLFDVAGRRVSMVAKGMARPGKFTQQLSFESRSGAALPNGVFFLRLRVGTDILKRTLVLTR